MEKETDISFVLGNENYLTELPRDIQRFIKTIVTRHGGGRLSYESKGLHLYIPCPRCLEEKGARELDSKHMTINIDKYFGRNQYALQKPGAYKKSSYCHRSDSHAINVDQLLTYRHIKDRGYNPTSLKVNVTVQNTTSLIDDGKGNLIPRHPGEVVPITALPANHPAVEYLVNRGYNLESLYSFLRVSYCTREWPEDAGDASKGIQPWRYRRMPNGWKDTPQGRIIFYVDNFGIQKGWQGRILEKVEGDVKYFWHPYRNFWDPIYTKIGDEWVLNPKYDKEANNGYAWDGSKYRTASGMARSLNLMGLDAAVAWNNEHKPTRPLIFLVEGPLDAARIGPPACALLGKTLSPDQCKLLRSFKHVVLVLDNDKAGIEAVGKTSKILTSASLEYSICELPDSVKDVGEMDYESVQDLIEPFICE